MSPDPLPGEQPVLHDGHSRTFRSRQAVTNGPAVLVTSAGRRVSLLLAFRKAAVAQGWRVLAADSDPLAPALYRADAAFRLPPVDAETYETQLLSLISSEGVRLIVPTIDPELARLALLQPALAGHACMALVSSREFIDITADKWLTVTAFAERGIRTPRSWLPGQYVPTDLPDRLFIKPRHGSASRGARPVTLDMLGSAERLLPNAVIQEELHGNEITIDALLDMDGTPVHYVPRLRIKTIGGESVQGVTLRDDDLREWLITLLRHAASMGARGPLTLQAFLSNDGPVLSEINPRFGGGFPLTEAAGGHYPAWLLRLATGGRIEPRFGDYRTGLYMTRYYVEYVTERPLWD